MAATTVASLLSQARKQLRELSARFWADDELTEIMQNGVTDLWGAILDVHGEHYLTRSTAPILRAGDDKISNMPEDCFRVLGIEPAVLTSDGSGRLFKFFPRKYTHPEFAFARSLTAQDQGIGGIIYYHASGAGWPVDTMQILTAPILSADLALRIIYNPGITLGNVNPIPGGSDNALKAWTIAYARAKENETQTPDAGWLAIYGTEKQLILTRITPRQEQEPEVVEDFFGGMGSSY
jgi:hypothetical protein